MLIGGRDDLRIALAAARLDHGADAVAGGHVEVVAKRQERVRGHDRTGQRELLIGGLHRGEARGVHAAHLTCAHAEGDAGAREHDGVGFHELAHRPGEPQVRELRIRRLAAREHGELARRQARQIARLRQQSCADAAQLEFAARELRPLPEHQHPYVGLAGQHARGRGVHRGRRQHLDELALEDRGRGRRVELAVEGDDAAVRGARIGAVGTRVGVERRGRHSDPAGVGVLDDDAGGLRELAHALDGGIRVRNVVVRKVLALQHVRRGDAGAAPGRVTVQRRALVRIFPVTQVLHLLEQERQGRGERLARRRLLCGQVSGDRGVVAGGVGEGLGGEACARGEFTATLVRVELSEQQRIIRRIDHDQHRFVVLRRRAQHRRAPDVDVLDGVGVAAAGPGHRGRKRVEVHHQQIDGRDSVLRHDGVVHAAAAQEPAVNLRMQGLDPTVHDLGKAGVGGDFAHRHAVLREQLRRAAGGQDLDVAPGEGARQLDEAGLVGNRKERAAYRRRHGLHPSRAPGR